MRWYASLIQCIYQYHPSNIVKDWEKIEAILSVMLRQWEKNTIFEWGLDLLFNLVLCVTNVHISHEEFKKDSNRKYETMKNLSWAHT